MTWCTILFVSKKDDPDLYKRVVDVCNYCCHHDRTFFWGKREGGKGIVIESTSKTQAFKRGSYFHKKLGVNYQVAWKQNE